MLARSLGDRRSTWGDWRRGPLTYFLGAISALGPRCGAEVPKVRATRGLFLDLLGRPQPHGGSEGPNWFVGMRRSACVRYAVPEGPATSPGWMSSGWTILIAASVAHSWCGSASILTASTFTLTSLMTNSADEASDSRTSWAAEALAAEGRPQLRATGEEDGRMRGGAVPSSWRRVE